MPSNTESLSAEMERHIRAFLMSCLEEDAIELRPGKPRLRGPIPPTGEKVFRILLFTFENVQTGLCNPSIKIVGRAVGCSESSVKRLLKGLRYAEFLHWKTGGQKRKRIWTGKRWRVVRATNEYQFLCPRRHLAALRRFLTRIYRGRHTSLIQAMVSRHTPPSEEKKEAVKIVETLAADLRPGPPRTEHTASPIQDSDPPSQAPPEPPGGVEMAGVRVGCPRLANALSGLWRALEKREQDGQGGSAQS